MRTIETNLSGVLILEPKVFGDSRGFFFECYNRRAFQAATGLDVEFVQDNHSRSAKGVLRGLHYQIQHAQGKLVRVTAGSVFDVVVDLRKASPTFGQIECVELSAENRRMLWIPPGFGHGFLVTSDSAEFLYKTTDYWAPEFERCVRWDDADLAIPWPLDGAAPSLSAKDAQGRALVEAEVFE